MNSKYRIYYFIFLATGIIKKLLKTTEKKKKKNHDKLLVLAKSKLNGIETLVFQARIDYNFEREGGQIWEDERKCQKW